MPEGHSRSSIADAVAQALAAAGADLEPDDARIDFVVESTWEDEQGFHARVGERHEKLSEQEKDHILERTHMSVNPYHLDPEELLGYIENGAAAFLAVLAHDVSEQYRRPEEPTYTMQEDPHFSYMHHKIEEDFEHAEFPEQEQKPEKDYKPEKAGSYPEPHPEGTYEEEER